MSMNVAKPTYEELTKIVKDQELEIQDLLKKERSTTNLEFYFKESLDLVCIAGTDYFYKEINPAFIKILGYTKEELLSKSLINFIHPDDLERSKKDMDILALGISPINFENRLIKKSGEIVYIQWTTSVDTSKKIIYAIGRDISEIKKIQADLIESEELLENAQKISKTGSWEYDFTNHKMIWSNELYAIYELEKKDNQDLFEEHVNRFSKSDIALFLDKIKEARISKKPFEVEQRVTLSNDKTKWVYAIVYPIVDENGNVIALRGTTQDITEKRKIRDELDARRKTETELKLKLIEEESNQKFKNYIENAPDGIFIANENGNFVEVNEAVSLFSGYSEKELLTLSMMDLTHQESIEKLDVCFGRLKILGESKGEFKIVHKTGEVRWSRVDSVKLSETRFMGFVKDITEIKRANDLLINTFDRITDAFVALDMDWCYTYMNKKAGEILNCDPVEMIGKNIWAEFSESVNGSYYNTCFKSIETQKHNHFENFHEFSERWFENHIYPSNDGMSIFFRDITNEKVANNKIEENEKRFKSLVENNEGIITVVDENLNVLFRSPSSKKITGYTDKEFDEIPDNEYFHPDYLEYIYEIIKKAVNNPGKLFPALFRVKHKNGHYIWLEGVINNRFHDSNVNGIVANFRNVTDKMEANATLQKERDVFAKIAATSPGLIYSMRQNFDGSLCYPYASDAIKEIYGHSFEEVASNANVIFDLIHPDDKERVIAKIINTKTNLVPLKGEYRYQHPTKGTVWHEVNSLPVVEPEGTVICHGIITDITERKKAEEALKKMHKKLESIFDAIPDLLFEVGIDGNIYNFHSRNTDLPQIYSNDIIGKTFFDILPLDAANLVLSAINEAIVNRFSNGRQYSLSCPTGIRWFELSIAPMEENEHHDTHFICLSREITDAKKGDEALLKSEERYRGLLNNLDAGVVVHALDTSIIMNNQKASDLLGLKEEQMFGKLNTYRGLIFLNEDGSTMLFENIPVNQIISTKKSIKNFTAGIKRLLSNDIVWILVNGYPLFDSKGDLAEIVISFIDISKRKLMEIEIVEGRKQAESANKAKTDFLANMSHEIRTPLNGIIGFTNLLMKSKLGKNQSEYMSTINESAISLMQIISDVLDFSKIESGKLELEKEGIDLFKLSHLVINLFKHQAQEKDIDLLLFIDKAVPQFVLADSVRLKQILVNLLSNALKFTIVGEVSLYINAVPDVNENYSTVQFAVKDSGIGIKEINNDKIFQSFVQEDSSTTRKFGGTGLGLAISNQLLALMDSKINMTSNYGVGSEFFFEIKFEKLRDIKKLDSKEKRPLDNEVIIDSKVLKNKKVLIVEDNRINMLLAKTLVKRLISNCTIYEARDGNEAIEQYKNEKPDIILMDIQMPNKNGYEATLQIRELEDSEEIPIIAVTAGIMIGDKEKCFEAGLNDYLSKPIMEYDLEKMLFKWLNR